MLALEDESLKEAQDFRETCEGCEMSVLACVDLHDGYPGMSGEWLRLRPDLERQAAHGVVSHDLTPP